MNLQDKIAALNEAIEKATDPKIKAAYKLLKLQHENSLNPETAKAVAEDLYTESKEVQEAGIECPKCGKVSKSKAGSASHQRNCKVDEQAEVA